MANKQINQYTNPGDQTTGHFLLTDPGNGEYTKMPISYLADLFPFSGDLLVLDDIAALEASTTTDPVCFVKDPKRGGLFYKGTGTANNGTIFNHATNGQWLRAYDRTKPVHVDWWGAAANGTTDDKAAIEAAYAFCLANATDLQYGSGVYRITGQIVIGYKVVDEADLRNRNFTTAPSYNGTAWTSARFANPITSYAGAKTILWFDFEPVELTACIWYGIIGGGNSGSPQLQPRKPAFVGRFTFLAKEQYNGTTYTPSERFNKTNLQIGLVMFRNIQTAVLGARFEGFHTGIFTQDNYFCEHAELVGDVCGTCFDFIGYNSNDCRNLSANYSDLGMYLQGSTLKTDAFNAEYCEIGIKLIASSFVCNEMYLENDNLIYPNGYQLIYGVPSTDPLYEGANQHSYAIINGLTATAGTGRPIILMEDSAGQLTITSSQLFGDIDTSVATNKISYINVRRASGTDNGPGTFTTIT